MASGVDVDENVASLWDDMKIRHKYKYMVFKLAEDNKKIVPTTLEEDVNVSFADFVERECRSDSCCYAVFDYHYEVADGGKREKVIFITWGPDTAPVKKKMLHASSKDALKKKLTGFAKELQASSLSDVDEADLLKDLRARFK